MKLSNQESGFTLIEVMIAIAVLVIGILSLYTMQISSIQGNSTANQLTTASNLALDQIEQILSWDASDARLNDSENINFQRIGPAGTINDVADNSRIFDNYTVYWDGTAFMDPGNPAQQVGIDMQIHVVWTAANRLKTVTMFIAKPI
jgi:prepilin-type N-terminal cleavage/methylation domain-containing protein